MSNIDQGVVEQLSALTDEELRETLFEVFKVKRPNPEEDAYNRNCYFLGTASIMNDAEPNEKAKWGKPEIEAVAYIDREKYSDGLGPDWGFCQFGHCECGVAVRSNYKEGICPICSSKVKMT